MLTTEFKATRFSSGFGIEIDRKTFTHTKRGMHTSLRKRINDSLGEPCPAPPPKIAGIARRCQDCAYKKDRKTKHTCCKCNKFICREAAYSQDTNIIHHFSVFALRKEHVFLCCFS